MNRIMRFFICLLLGVFILALVILPVSLADGPLVGEIKLWPAETPPDGWMTAEGQSISCSTYADLCDVLGATYGGDGTTTAYLPDFYRRFPVGAEAYTGFPCPGGQWCYWLGEQGGEEFHTLTVPEMPSHNHQIEIDLLGGLGSARYDVASPNTGSAQINSYSTGGGQAHNNTPLFNPVYFIIFTGVYSATPTPTPTPTGTSTPVTGTLYLPYIDAYTHTLQSGQTLTVPVQISFGQVIVSGLSIILAAITGLDILFKLVYRE